MSLPRKRTVSGTRRAIAGLSDFARKKRFKARHPDVFKAVERWSKKDFGQRKIDAKGMALRTLAFGSPLVEKIDALIRGSADGRFAWMGYAYEGPLCFTDWESRTRVHLSCMKDGEKTAVAIEGIQGVDKGGKGKCDFNATMELVISLAKDAGYGKVLLRKPSTHPYYSHSSEELRRMLGESSNPKKTIAEVDGELKERMEGLYGLLAKRFKFRKKQGNYLELNFEGK